MKNRIKDIREEKDIKQKIFCEIFDKKQPTISGWENDIDNIPLKALIKYSEILDSSIDYILYLSDKNLKYNNDFLLDKKDIGNKLRTLREKLGYTQKEFAKVLGISTSTYEKYEEGSSLINGTTLYLICKEYKLSFDEMLGRTRIKKLGVF